MCTGRLTLTGRDDLLSPGDAFAGAAVVGVASEEAAADGVPSEAAADVIRTPDPTAPDAGIAGAGGSVVAAASPQ